MFSISDLLHVSRLIFCLSINPCSGPSVRRSASLVDSRVIVKSGPHLSVWCTSCVVMWYIGCPFPFPFTFSFRLPPTRWRTRKLPRGAAAPEVQGVGAGPLSLSLSLSLHRCSSEVLFSFVWIRVVNLIRHSIYGWRG